MDPRSAGSAQCARAGTARDQYLSWCQPRYRAALRCLAARCSGQALRAASIRCRRIALAHSLHAYFLRRGDFQCTHHLFRRSQPRWPKLQRRRVTAPSSTASRSFTWQHHFRVRSRVLNIRQCMPDGSAAGELGADAAGVARQIRCLACSGAAATLGCRPFEFRIVESTDPSSHEHSLPVHNMWIRTVEPLPDDEVLHRCLLAYVSDFHLLQCRDAATR